MVKDCLISYFDNLDKPLVIEGRDMGSVVFPDAEYKVYSDADLVNIPLEEIDIIQLPFSIYDQRLLKNGTLKKLSDFNISIHIRSVFLQGLILTSPEKWPLFINNSFSNHHERLCQYLADENMKILDFIFWFLSAELNIEAVRSHGRVWKYKGEAIVDGKKMADAQWAATIVDRK